MTRQRVRPFPTNFEAFRGVLSEGTGKVSHFEGTPIPTSILLVGMMSMAAWSGALRDQLWFGEVTLGGLVLHPLVLVFALSGSLMISRLRVPKP